jgi:hypothetical protein
MIHQYISDDLTGSHYAVNVSTSTGEVLVQIQDREHNQVRIPLTAEQTQHLIALLQLNLNIIQLPT